MAKKKPTESKALNCLLDTSVARAAVTSPKAYAEHLAQEISVGKQFVSLYVRMEFIRGLVIELLRFSSLVPQVATVEEALHIAEQAYVRTPKTVLSAIRKLLDKLGSNTDPIVAAEEVAHYARIVLKEFDRRFGSRIPNNSGCQIGGLPLELDFNNLDESVKLFYEKFCRKIEDCDVWELLGIKKDKKDPERLLGSTDCLKVDTVESLAEFKAKRKRVTCVQCKRVGDVVIVLESPPSFIIAHNDENMGKIAKALDKRTLKTTSAPAYYKNVRGVKQLGASE
jgi:hypothetical protein